MPAASLRSIILAGLLLGLAACTPTTYTGPAPGSVPESYGASVGARPSQEMMSQALVAVINNERAARRKVPLRAEMRMIPAAAAKADFAASGKPMYRDGKRVLPTLAARLEEGLGNHEFGAIGEQIHRTSTCGEEGGRKSYAELAGEAVDAWMQNVRTRGTVLSFNYERAAGAVSFRETGQACEEAVVAIVVSNDSQLSPEGGRPRLLPFLDW